MVLMNRVLVKNGEGLDSLWRSEVDRTVLQCYCSTKTRGNPSKRTNRGNLAGGASSLERPPHVQPTAHVSPKEHIWMHHISGAPMLLATCEVSRACMVIADRVDSAAGRG